MIYLNKWRNTTMLSKINKLEDNISILFFDEPWNLKSKKDKDGVCIVATGEYEGVVLSLSKKEALFLARKLYNTYEGDL